MTAYQNTHNADCELCRSQLTSPRLFHDDLCRWNIAPDCGDRDDNTIIQCPHAAIEGPGICSHHLEHAITGYAQIAARTAPFN